MEGKSKLVFAIVIIVMVLMSARNVMVKKVGKKPVEEKTKVVELPAEKPVVVEEEKKSEVPVVVEESPVKEVIEEAPAPTEVVVSQSPEVKTLTVQDYDEIGSKALCESESEKEVCRALPASSPYFKGVRILDTKLMVFVTNASFLGTAERYVNPVVIDPMAPPVDTRQNQGNSEADLEKKKSVAGALALREYLPLIQGHLKSNDLILVFLKDSVSAMPMPTFGLECKNEGILYFNSGNEITEEKLKNMSFNYSSVCRNL